MNADRRRFDAIAERIMGAVYAVANEVGVGFLEKVCENSMYAEPVQAGSSVRQQEPIVGRCKGIVVGEYIADLLVEDEVIVEPKAVQKLDEIHEAQCIHCVRATGKRVCLLINFGKTGVEDKRLVHRC